MNLKHLEEKGFEKYEGKKCQLEKCTHNANLFMYKLSEEYAGAVAKKSKKIIAEFLDDNTLDEWKQTSEGVAPARYRVGRHDAIAIAWFSCKSATAPSVWFCNIRNGSGDPRRLVCT